MSTTTRKETPQQARKNARQSTLTPLYAVAGLTDLIAEQARTRLTDAQHRAGDRITALKLRPTDLQAQAKQNADELAKFVADLPTNLRALPQTTRERLDELQRQANDQLTDAGTVYGDLAGRGRRRVEDAVNNAQAFSGRARQRTTDGLKATDPLFEAAQETATKARQKTTGRTATPTVTPKRKPAAQKSTAKKTTTKKTPAGKTSAKKTAAK